MKAALPALVLGIALAASAQGPVAARDATALNARVEAYFTPGDDVARMISERIAAARHTVQVQAYVFTNRRIATALAKAAQSGVPVDLIGDAKQHEAGGFPVLRQLARAGVRIWLHGEYAAFHNKVIIVDAGTPLSVVVTGSYNFTQAAQSKNAENIVVISGSPELADRFARDFERHRAQSSRLQ